MVRDISQMSHGSLAEKPIVDTEGNCSHSRIWRTLSTSISQERTPRLTTHDKLIMRRRKDRPWGATLHACWRWPIKDSRSFRLQKRLCNQASKRAVILSNASLGSRTCRFSESSSISRTVMPVDVGVETHAKLGNWKQSINLSRLCWQTDEPGGPRVWKSSR